MNISTFGKWLLLLTLVTNSALAADAIARSGFENAACTTTFEFDDTGNDLPFTAESETLDPSTRSVLICGSFSSIGDVDYFQVSVDATSNWLIETIRADAAPCTQGTTMTVQLLDSNLTQLATNSAGGDGGCASLDGSIWSALQNLPSGTYLIRLNVDSVSANDPPSSTSYALRIKLL